MNYTPEQVLDVLKRTNIPKKVPNALAWHTVTLPGPDGWWVSVYYDGEEFDFADLLVSPNSEVIELFRQGIRDTPDWDICRNYNPE